MFHIDLTSETIEVTRVDPSESVEGDTLLVILVTGQKNEESPDSVLFDGAEIPRGPTSVQRSGMGAKTSVFRMSERDLSKGGVYTVSSSVTGARDHGVRKFRFEITTTSAGVALKILRGGTPAYWIYENNDPQRITGEDEHLFTETAPDGLAEDSSEEG